MSAESPVPTDLIVITIAASRLGVSMDTLRNWADSGGTDGFTLDVWRDPATNIRYFRRAQIEALVVRRSRRFIASRAPIASSPLLADRARFERAS